MAYTKDIYYTIIHQFNVNFKVLGKIFNSIWQIKQFLLLIMSIWYIKQLMHWLIALFIYYDIM